MILNLAFRLMSTLFLSPCPTGQLFQRAPAACPDAVSKRPSLIRSEHFLYRHGPWIAV